MKTTYILGAGASAQFAQGQTSVPVTRDFLSEAYSHHRQGFGETWNFIADFYNLGGITPKKLENVNVEELLSVLDLAIKRGDDFSGKYPHYEIQKIYAKTSDLVWETLRTVFEGPFCDIHRELAGNLQIGDNVISFNWDILMDNAMSNQRGTADFHAACGYGFFPSFVERHDGEAVAERCEHDLMGTVRFRLLKLHGSMNWLQCPSCGRITVLKAKKASFDIDGTLGRCKFDQRNLKRVFIPFSYFKNFSEEPFGTIWRHAYMELSKAERIVIIGYSLPESDFHAKDLFLRSRANNDSLQGIVVVDRSFQKPQSNKSMALKKKFSTIFRTRASEIRVFPSTLEFLADDARARTGRN